jgi:hypothetical protein
VRDAARSGRLRVSRWWRAGSSAVQASEDPERCRRSEPDGAVSADEVVPVLRAAVPSKPGP